MRKGEVIICYVLYQRESLVLQGTFDTVYRAFPFTVAPGRCGHVLTFDVQTDGTDCRIGAQLVLPDGTRDALDIALPVNRTKVKWRKFLIDEEHKLFLRAALV